ncbi:MAG: transposase, partial [Moheibacter sp.]
IVGYDLSDSLELTGCVRALQKALKQSGKRSPQIHHSDRGVQYCSNMYTDLLLKNDIEISMTEENHCYENAVAEWVNGILKYEFFLDQTFFSSKVAFETTKNVIKLYNSKRLHLSLDFKTPENVYKSIA